MELKSSESMFIKMGLLGVACVPVFGLAQSLSGRGLEQNLIFNIERAAAGGDCRLNENLFVIENGNTLMLRTKDVGFDLQGQGTRRVACTLAIPVTLPPGFELVAVQQNVTYWARKSQGQTLSGSVAYSAGFAARMSAPVVIDLGESAIDGASFFKNDQAALVSGIPRCSASRETVARVNLVLSGIGTRDSDELSVWWRSDDVQKFNFILAPCER